MSIKVGINGFGRIGRDFFKTASKDDRFDVVLVNDLTNPKTLAHLLKYDSIGGIMDADISYDETSITVDGKKITITSERNPADIPWDKAGVEIVLESTGLFLTKETGSRHLGSSVKKVIMSAPAKDPDFTVVLGVNEETYDPKAHNIISNASCTTNCLAPMAKVLMDNFGISKGLMTTIHSYTNDQKILDQPHKDLRRTRAAAVSMIPTTTGAAKAVSLVIPKLQGKLDGMAIRVPTPNVSLVDLVVTVEKDTTAGEVNAKLKEAANGTLKGILQFCEDPLVSIDFCGNPHSSIVDASLTSVIGGNMVKVLSWYDNEHGYATRVRDLMVYLKEKGL